MTKKKKSLSTLSVVVTSLFVIGGVVSTIMAESRALTNLSAASRLVTKTERTTTSRAVRSSAASPIPSILELVGNTDNYTCPEGLVVVKDSIDPSFYEPSERKIPKVIHLTSKTRCMTQAFSDNVDKWRLPGHSVFIHDDDAVDMLLNRWWPEFPQLHDTLKCMLPGASMADLWRYLLLWVFGGVYTDIDNAPGPWFWNETGSAITNETDALFEQEHGGFPSQYFFAASPHHPVMFLAVYDTMHRVMDVESVQRQYVPFVTGPGAIKKAFIHFAGGKGYPDAGLYHGSMTKNRSVTVVGSRKIARSGAYLRRDTRSVQKGAGYNEMNLTHWSKVNTTEKPDHWCITVLGDIQEENQMENFKRHFRV
mmetsp:Transcript_18764/g.23625  ORF Transcript_18764/g.23625 Transcript_18764/m.23625 type:complete len:366 (+) Transcript_18764:124-1221(+)